MPAVNSGEYVGHYESLLSLFVVSGAQESAGRAGLVKVRALWDPQLHRFLDAHKVGRVIL